MSYNNLRRVASRVAVDGFCSEYVAERQLLSRIVDVSESGLKLQRLLKRGRNPDRIVQLEFELPALGEVIWAKGEICFDQLWPVEVAGRCQPLRTSGVRLVAAAQKHLRMLREYVVESGRAMRNMAVMTTMDEPDAWMWRAAHFLRA
jgi:hypothetical protein